MLSEGNQAQRLQHTEFRTCEMSSVSSQHTQKALAVVVRSCLSSPETQAEESQVQSAPELHRQTPSPEER